MAEFFGQGAVREDRRAGKHVVPGAAEGIDVAASVCGGTVPGLFRGDVVDGADGRARTCDAGLARVVGRASEPHVGELDDTVSTDEKVRGLDVPMNDAPGVGLLESGGRLPDDFQRTLDWQAASRGDQLADVGAVDVFQRDVELVIDRTGLVNADNVLVPQFPCGHGFGTKTLHERGIVGFLDGHHLQGDLAVLLRVVGEVDEAHSPLAEQTFDPETSQRLGKVGRGRPRSGSPGRLWRVG